MNHDREAAQLPAIIRRLSQPLAPLPTEVAPELKKLNGIRAVMFDVYGTLLISGSGDISLTSGVARGAAAAEALQTVGLDGSDGERVVATLLEVISKHHAESPHEFPEVDILDVWRDVLAALDLRLEYDLLPTLAIEYECRVNPIWTMPGISEVLAVIHAAGLALGIVSNAQFFTPLALYALLGEPLQQIGFDQQLCVWSFAELRAKPGRFLYDRAAALLADRGVAPGETLYVGNDMRNDIGPAAEVGFCTALFAGDARSLRLRSDDPRLAGVEPDAIITELTQLLHVLSLATG